VGVRSLIVRVQPTLPLMHMQDGNGMAWLIAGRRRSSHRGAALAAPHRSTPAAQAPRGLCGATARREWPETCNVLSTFHPSTTFTSLVAAPEYSILSHHETKMNLFISLLALGVTWFEVAGAVHIKSGKAFDRLITIWLENQVCAVVPRFSIRTSRFQC